MILFQKSSDCQNFLNAKLENPYTLKKSIPYRQALRIRRIWSTFQDYHSHSRKPIEQFVNKEYKKDVVIQQIQKVDQLKWKQLLHQQKHNDKQYIPLSVTYSRALPNLKDAISATFNTLVDQKRHRKDVKNPNAIPACKDFNRYDHDFNNQGKIIIIEQLRNIRTASTETLKERLNRQIMKLETLAAHGLKEDLNWIHFMETSRSLPLFLVSAYRLK